MPSLPERASYIQGLLKKGLCADSPSASLELLVTPSGILMLGTSLLDLQRLRRNTTSEDLADLLISTPTESSPWRLWWSSTWATTDIISQDHKDPVSANWTRIRTPSTAADSEEKPTSTPGVTRSTASWHAPGPTVCMPYTPGRRKVTGVTGSARRREEGKVISEMAGNFLPRPLLRLRWRIGSGFVRSFEGFLRTVEGGGGPSTGLLGAAPSWLQNGVLPAPYTPLLHVLPPCLGTEALSLAEKTSRQSAPHPLTQTPQPPSDISLLQVKQWLEARHSPSRGRTGETVALIDDHEACCESELASAIALLVEHNCPGVHRSTVCAKPPCVQIFKWPRHT